LRHHLKRLNLLSGCFITTMSITLPARDSAGHGAMAFKMMYSPHTLGPAGYPDAQEKPDLRTPLLHKESSRTPKPQLVHVHIRKNRGGRYHFQLGIYHVQANSNSRQPPTSIMTIHTLAQKYLPCPTHLLISESKHRMRPGGTTSLSH